MRPAGGDDRAFRRGVRIAAGFAAAVLAIVMIVIVNRDRPLKWDAHPDPTAVSRANVQAGDNGPLPTTGNAPTNNSGVVVHPGKSQSELGAKP